ncbi:MAG: MBL fold metallo-hydrolase [Pyrinomonadaceae bacterium]
MKRVWISGLCLLQFVIFVSPRLAQEKTGPTWHAHLQARQVLEDGINALGGIENIRRADKITINYKAVNHPLGQNAAFDAPPAEFQRVGAKTLIDYSGIRYVTEGQSNSAGGYKFNFRSVIAPKRSFNIDVLRNRRGNEVRNLDERAKSQFKVAMLSEVPHLLMLYVSQRPETLRWLGEAEIGGRKFRAVSFAAENGAQISLYFDALTNLLAQTEQVDSHAQLGDITFGNSYSDYRDFGGVKIPRTRLTLVNQSVTSENEYAEVKLLDFADGEKLLEVPAGFVEAAPAATAAEVMRRVGDGVYLIERIGQSYRVMFVEFDDHVMILETPTDANVSKAIIKLVRQTIPGKPIRYVGFSHFHFDHTGGLREYIAEGAIVVVPPGNKTFVEQIAKSKFILKPDALALSPRPPVIETFEKKRVFTDGKRTVELYSIGPTSHVNDMVMFYFPKEKILFQGDMFSPLDAGGGIPPMIEINHELVKKVEELKLQVETLVAVHSGAVAWKEFRQAVADAAQR